MPDNNNGLSPQDLMLFQGQEVQTPDGIGILEWVGEYRSKVVFKDHISTPLNNTEVKPICRKMEDMTEEERKEFDKYDFANNTDGETTSMNIFWKQIKYFTSKGICPFDEFFEKGWVIEKVKQEA